jgi:archaemetzincin
MRKKAIIISPIGKISPWIIEAIVREIRGIFKLPTRRMPLLNDILFAHDPRRNQYYSTKILDALESCAPKECIKLLAVTREDLFIPILTHVYGEAKLGGLPSIISISRLIEYTEIDSREKNRSRIIKEAAHELGHTFDLRHCPDHTCIMHYCRKIEEVDQKSEQFCRYCKILLSDNITVPGQ